MMKHNFYIEGYDNSQHLRKEAGLYYHLEELFNKGVLTTWEMGAIDRIYSVYLAEDIKNLEARGLIDHS